MAIKPLERRLIACPPNVGLTARLRSLFLDGVTNQSAADALPSWTPAVERAESAASLRRRSNQSVWSNSSALLEKPGGRHLGDTRLKGYREKNLTSVIQWEYKKLQARGACLKKRFSIPRIFFVGSFSLVFFYIRAR